MKKSTNHDTLVIRLTQILIKLNQGERLDPKLLADEFGVNARTIQRDLNQRFSYLPLQKADGKYSLQDVYLGKLNSADVERFATLAGVHGMFPSFSVDFLRDIFDVRMQTAFVVKGNKYEDLRGREFDFRQLEIAVVEHRLIDFSYFKEGLKVCYTSVQPYKLVNYKGLWYLSCLDGGKIKSFSFSKIQEIRVKEDVFTFDSSLQNKIMLDDGIYFGDSYQEVVFKVDPVVSGYFKRRNVLPNQGLIKELSDGSLVVSSKTSNENHLMAIMRYWIPYLFVVSPDSFREKCDEIIKSYIANK